MKASMIVYLANKWFDHADSMRDLYLDTNQPDRVDFADKKFMHFADLMNNKREQNKRAPLGSKIFNVWVEGYCGLTINNDAVFLGEYQALRFSEAVTLAINDNKRKVVEFKTQCKQNVLFFDPAFDIKFN